MHKRKFLPARTYDEILAEDVSRANKKMRLAVINRKRKSEVALGELSHSGTKPNLLGPILTRRFMEVTNSLCMNEQQ